MDLTVKNVTYSHGATFYAFGAKIRCIVFYFSIGVPRVIEIYKV